MLHYMEMITDRHGLSLKWTVHVDVYSTRRRNEAEHDYRDIDRKNAKIVELYTWQWIYASNLVE